MVYIQYIYIYIGLYGSIFRAEVTFLHDFWVVASTCPVVSWCVWTFLLFFKNIDLIQLAWWANLLLTFYHGYTLLCIYNIYIYIWIYSKQFIFVHRFQTRCVKKVGHHLGCFASGVFGIVLSVAAEWRVGFRLTAVVTVCYCAIVLLSWFLVLSLARNRERSKRVALHNSLSRIPLGCLQ